MLKKVMQKISLVFMCILISISFMADSKIAYALILPTVPLPPDIPIILPPDIDWDEIYSTEYPLSAYEYLRISNTKDYTEYKGWNYLDFIDMKLYRNDGRLIYDDWGSLSYSDIVNYESYIDISTQLMQYNKNGFLASTLNSKLKSTSLSAPFLELQYIDKDTREKTSSYLDTGAIHDLNENIGNGKYVNYGINPGVETYKFTDIDIASVTEEYMFAQMYFQGKAYWENAWWGGTGDSIDLYESISTLFKVANRDWNNEFIVQEDLIVDEYQNSPIYYYHMPFVATANNLSNYIKINDEMVTPIENEKVMPYDDGHRILIDNAELTKIELESGSENNYETYYVLMDDSLPQLTLNTTNENALKQYQEEVEVVDEKGFKSKNIYATYKQPVQINFETVQNESLETATYTLNNETYNLLNGEWLDQEGEYVVTITDLVGHKTNLYLTINTTLDFSLIANENEISTTQAEYINRDISVVTTANLSIEILKNGEVYEYAFGDILSEEALYEITISNDSSNVKNFNITIDKSPPNISLINVENDGVTNQIVRLEFLENDINATYYLNENLMGDYLSNSELIYDGIYQIKVFDLASNEANVNFEIDTVAPTILLVGVENGGQTQAEVSAINLSEPVNFLVTKDTLELDYQAEQVLKAVGDYEMIVIDEAGNETVYTFEIIFVLNAAAIALFAGLVALAVAGTIFLIKSTGVYYVN